MANEAVRRSPQGERASLPARGAWVETLVGPRRAAARGSRSPQGERGLKQARRAGRTAQDRVAPRKGSVG